MKNNFNKTILSKIKSILLKKSEGYYYNEEILEYQNNFTETKTTETEQINFLDKNNHEQEQIKKPQDLTLLKKKVTTHYVPPDLLAIKMLIEIFGEKVESDELSYLTDQELEDLKTEILKKLNEN